MRIYQIWRVEFNWTNAVSVLVGTFSLSAVYLLEVGSFFRKESRPVPVPTWRKIMFFSGAALMVFVLIGPLDTAADQDLFSAHMLQHMLLIYAVPALLIAGVPMRLVERWLLDKHYRPLFSGTAVVAACFVISTLIMWIWHLPVLYDAALEKDPIHILQHLMFIGAGFFWWLPLMSSEIWTEMPSVSSIHLKRCAYLFLSLFPCTALAAMITLANHPFYSFYTGKTIQWGVTALVDQQIGGLIMWIPGDVLLMILFLVQFSSWLNHSASFEKQMLEPFELKTKR